MSANYFFFQYEEVNKTEKWQNMFCVWNRINSDDNLNDSNKT